LFIGQIKEILFCLLTNYIEEEFLKDKKSRLS